MRQWIESQLARGIRASLFATWAAILLVAHSASAQSPSPGTLVGGKVPSVLEIPLDIDLDPLFRKAESMLPWQAGHWQQWRREKGIETRYRAWRGPLAMSLQGDLLTVQAHVRYWVQARKRVLGTFDLEVGCGVDEPPRQAVVGLLVRLAWGPDWTLRPSFHILPTHFIDRCEVTVADVDVSPIIGSVFRRRMEDSLRAALSELRPSIDEARLRAVGYWQALQRPVELYPGVWMTANPLTIAMAPLFGSGRRLQTILGLAMLPRLEAEAPSQGPLRPLPPLRSFVPRGSSMRFDLALAVDLDRVSELLFSDLVDRDLTLEGRSIRIGPVGLRGEGKDVILTADLEGEVAGRVEIRATTIFDPAAQRFRLADLDFVYDPNDSDLSLMVNLFYLRIKEALTEAANALLDEQVGLLHQGLTEALEGALPKGIELDLTALRLTQLNLEIGADAIRMRGSATGSVTLTAR